MKTTDIINLYTTLTNLRECGLKARVSFSMARNLKTILPIVEDYEQARLKLLQTSGAADPSNPNQYIVPPESVQSVLQELDELGSVDVEVPLLKIKLSDIEDLDISIQDACNLECMIEEES